MSTPRLLLLLLLAIAAPAALASAWQPVESIRDAALATVADRDAPGVRAEAAVDPALRLPRCAEPLQANPGHGGTVEVGCASAGWRLYIPVRVQRLQPVLVLTRAISAGEPIPPDAVQVEQRDVSRLAGGSFADPTQIADRVARRVLMAGSVLSPADVVPPRTVRRGDSVTLVARYGAVEVRASGRALGEAGLDERVSVENLGSRRVVQGVVRPNGEVLVLR